MTVAQEAPLADQGLVARIVGVLLSPKDTFAAIAARPRWLGVMAITLVVVAACQFLIMSSPEMQDAMIEQATRNPNVSDQQLDATERFIGVLPYVVAGATLILGPLFSIVIAGILLLIFSTLMGGEAKFKQVFAVMAHSGVVSSLSQGRDAIEALEQLLSSRRGRLVRLSDWFMPKKDQPLLPHDPRKKRGE